VQKIEIEYKKSHTPKIQTEKIENMKNIVGHVPRGEDFYPRDKVVRQIYRRLDNGSHIYLAAPRRVGKTAIMRHLEDNPSADYQFEYLIVESANHASDYFKRLLETLRDSNGLAEKSLQHLKELWKTLEEIEVTGIKISLRENHAETHIFFKKLKQQLQDLQTDGHKLVIMLDEFPQTVENIRREHGDGEAEQFLQFNRELRQQSSAVQFIYTGSIGLSSIAEKLDATKEINDLNTVEVPPLTAVEAKDLLQRLLKHEHVVCSDSTLQHLLDKLKWFVPFHIQLAAQGIIDRHDEVERGLLKDDINQIFTDITNARHNQYFEHYYSRLQKTLDTEELKFAQALLHHLAREDSADETVLKSLAGEFTGIAHVLRSLIFDGYVFRHESGIYRFTSPLLQQWWQVNVFEEVR